MIGDVMWSSIRARIAIMNSVNTVRMVVRVIKTTSLVDMILVTSRIANEVLFN